MATVDRTAAGPKPAYLSSIRLDTRPTAFQRKLMRLLSRYPRGLHEATCDLHRVMLRIAVERNSHNGVPNLSAIAREFGIQRHTLYRLLRRLEGPGSATRPR